MPHKSMYNYRIYPQHFRIISMKMEMSTEYHQPFRTASIKIDNFETRLQKEPELLVCIHNNINITKL